MKNINLQLFAEEQLPTETVENDDATDVVFDKTAEQDTTDDKAKKQHNYQNAQRRVEKKEMDRKKREEELKTAQRNGYVEGIKKANNGINPYTGEEIKDDVDAEILETMMQMESEGLNPTEDYHRYIGEKRRKELNEARAKKEEEQRSLEKFHKESQEFIEKYGKEKFDEITEENSEALKELDSFANEMGLYGRASLTEIYQKFESLNKKAEAMAEKMLMEKEARRMASTGSLGKGDTKSQSSLSKMTPEERNKYLNKIINNY